MLEATRHGASTAVLEAADISLLDRVRSA